MSFRRFAITAVIASTTLLGCGNRIPVESPTGGGSTESASQASKASTDEIDSKLENDRSGKSDRGHHKGWDRRIAALTDSLGLSDEQIEDLNELYEDYQAEVKALIDSAGTSGNRSGLREKLKDLKDEFENDFSAVLTDEQQARFAEIRANAAASRRDRGWDRYIAALTDSLGLSDEQVEDLNDLYDDYQADTRAAVETAGESGDRSELRTKLKALRQEFADGFSAVLTDEQRARLVEIKANAAARRKESGWERYIDTLTDSLGLSDEQVEDLNKLYDDYQADIGAAIEAARDSGDRSGLREILDNLKEDFQDDFNAVLTDEQKVKLEEMKSAKRKRSGKGHGRKGRKG